MKYKLVAILAVILAVFAGCKPQHHRHYRNLEAPETVHVYKTHPVNSTDVDSWIYWYVILDNNHYYYCSSPDPVSDFNSVNWSTESSVPSEISGAESIGTESISGSALGADFASEVSAADAADFASEGPAGDMSAESSSNDSSGSDSSGGDSSGGDSGGGGDGGGGDGGE
jgi:uncharacterized membrane protein YgcG